MRRPLKSMNAMSKDSNGSAGVHSERAERIRERFGAHGIDGILVTSAANRRYLSGFAGSSANLIISGDRLILVTDGRYVTQAGVQAPEFELAIHSGPILDQVALSVADCGITNLGFDPKLTTVADRDSLHDSLDSRRKLVAVTGLVEELRLLKDEEEIASLRTAIGIGDAVMAEVETAVKPGATELNVAIMIEQQFRLKGGSGAAFPVIVAAGTNAAMPHHSPTDKVIEEGESVVVDMGTTVDGYHSDMTRTFCAGGPTDQFKEIYAIVLEAQMAAIGGVRPGLDAAQCDGLAREVISTAGYGERFGHGTGHGVGLEIHEAPRVSATSADKLAAGMVHSVEPGIYLPEWGGVRIEDLVLVTDNGSEVLSKYPK